MSHFTVYILLIVFAIIFGISQSSDDCFYHPGYSGKKCFDESQTSYTCCPSDHRCQNGQCISLSALGPSHTLPLHVSILIGLGAAIFGLVCIIIGAVYWQRKQRNMIEQSFDPLEPFPQATIVPLRHLSSASSRARTATSQSSSNEASVHVQPYTITKS